MISCMRLFSWLIAACLAGCVLSRPEPTLPSGTPPRGESPSGTAQPGPVPGQAPPAPSERPAAQGPRQFHLGPAATALVAQARAQSGGGEFGQAAATLERALRIEPDNPLLWIELGRVRLGEGNAAQADAMGRKAVALATGDAGAQAAGWRLIADSLRARGRDPEAAEAEQRAGALSPH
jgi:tetratricopeptide (TPR) repeat protein